MNDDVSANQMDPTKLLWMQHRLWYTVYIHVRVNGDGLLPNLVSTFIKRLSLLMFPLRLKHPTEIVQGLRKARVPRPENCFFNRERFFVQRFACGIFLLVPVYRSETVEAFGQLKSAGSGVSRFVNRRLKLFFRVSKVLSRPCLLPRLRVLLSGLRCRGHTQQNKERDREYK